MSKIDYNRCILVDSSGDTIHMGGGLVVYKDHYSTNKFFDSNTNMGELISEDDNGKIGFFYPYGHEHSSKNPKSPLPVDKFIKLIQKYQKDFPQTKYMISKTKVI